MSGGQKIICPLCHDDVEKLVYRYHIDSEKKVINEIKIRNPKWTENDGMCSRCLDYYHTEIVLKKRMLHGIGPHFPVRSADDFIVIPTGLRLGSDPRFTGKGVTICFIDSDFYPHADLMKHRQRIKKYIDIPYDIEVSCDLEIYSNDSEGGWHGTMTSVVCAGDGYLSGGLYKGIACDAEVVLLKVQDKLGRITTENIVKALEWILLNHRQFDIRIVNISIGADDISSYKQSQVDLLAEQLVTEGVVVIAAVGNDEHGIIKAPANSPNVIAVGGINDNNSLEEVFNGLYHSTYGCTVDGLMKPELLAHSVWIAAPILPGTNEQKQSKLFHHLLTLDDAGLRDGVNMNRHDSPFIDLSGLEEADDIRYKLRQKIQAAKYISEHYMHVDGTSFAAPIISSVVAQLLEVNPQLSPASIREVLFSTAKRTTGLPPERQGFGVVRPRHAIVKVLKRLPVDKPIESPLVDKSQNTITFCLQHECASQVSLAGNFNQWSHDVLLMEPGKSGRWKLELPMLPAGRYAYKYLIDEAVWIEDINNPYREPDGHNGFNSILVIEN